MGWEVVGLSVEEVVDLEQDPFALEHYILMGVRYDSLLVDIVRVDFVDELPEALEERECRRYVRAAS
jgi:hypothetical protein